MNRNLLSNVLISLVLMILSACSGSKNPAPLTIKTGKFIDSPVAGLDFETVTQSGITNIDGEFQYLEGETITFKLGDTIFGSTIAMAEITPVDMVPGIILPTTHNQASKAFETQTFHHFLNKLVFLQTLDSDNNPDNGIVIPNEVRDLLNGVNIDFAMQIYRFKYNPSFRKLLNDGLALGLWSGTGRPIKNPYLALDHLYENLRISHKFYRIVKASEDTDADGNLDSHKIYAYDSNGNQSLLEEDDGANGITDYRIKQVYNSNGRLQLYERDNNANGIVNYRSTYTYDVNDNLITFERDNNARPFKILCQVYLNIQHAV